MGTVQGQLDRGQAAAIRRAAIGHALVSHGLLEYRRERQAPDHDSRD